MSEVGAINVDMRTQSEIQALDIAIREQQAGQTTTAKEVQQVMPVLGGGTKVTNTSNTVNLSVGTPNQIAGVEEIDQPDSEAAKLADLEKLIAYLTLENDEEQAKTAEERIKTLLSKVKSEHESAVNRINQAIEKTQEMLKQQKAMKIFGWVMTAVAIIAAVAATICTFGAAAGPSVAAIVGLVATWMGVMMSVATQVMQSTGAMDDIIEKDAQDRYEKAQKEGRTVSMSQCRTEASAKISRITAIIGIVLAVVSCGAGLASSMTNAAKKGAEAGAKAAMKAMDVSFDKSLKGVLKAILNVVKKGLDKLAQLLQSAFAQQISKIVMTVCGAIGTAGGIVSSVEGSRAAKNQEELAEMQANILEAQKVIDALQAMLEEEEESLKLILDYIMNDYAVIAEVLSKGTETVDEIYNIMGQTQV